MIRRRRSPALARLTAAVAAWFLLSASACAGVGGLGGGIGSIGSVASIGKSAGGLAGGVGTAGSSVGQGVRGGVTPAQRALQQTPNYAANRDAVGDAWAQTLASNPVDGVLDWDRDTTLSSDRNWLRWLSDADARLIHWLLCQQPSRSSQQPRTWRNGNSNVTFVMIGSPSLIRGGDNNTTNESDEDEAPAPEETCKPFTLIGNKDGETNKMRAIACQDDDGNWVVVEELGDVEDAA